MKQMRKKAIGGGEPEQERFLDVTRQAAADLFARDIQGAVLMLNLLRFRDMADYSASPELMPENPISGKQAYQHYIDHTLPLLRESGGDLILLGHGGNFLIGPQRERWDLVMLVRQKSLADFMAFAMDPENLAGLGHRTAALEDSRLLPLVETNRVA